MVSEKSLESENCKDELYHARGSKKNIINILTDSSTALPEWFSFRYGRFQMCNLFTFSSPGLAVEDLERKCNWLSVAKKGVGEAKGSYAIVNGGETVKPKTLYKGSARVGETIRFGRYIQKKGSAPEPVEWLMLHKEGGRALLISKYALDCQQYNTSYADVTWETCSLRGWLNGTFLDSAFSSEEQNSIISSTVTADKNPSYSTSPGNYTTDKVFLLSMTEVNKYFSSDEARKCAPTDYAIAQGADTNSGYWWLRSPGSISCAVVGVDFDGSVFDYGYGASADLGAVRPAMWISLEP